MGFEIYMEILDSFGILSFILNFGILHEILRFVWNFGIYFRIQGIFWILGFPLGFWDLISNFGIILEIWDLFLIDIVICSRVKRPLRLALTVPKSHQHDDGQQVGQHIGEMLA